MQPYSEVHMFQKMGAIFIVLYLGYEHSIGASGWFIKYIIKMRRLLMVHGNWQFVEGDDTS